VALQLPGLGALEVDDSVGEQLVFDASDRCDEWLDPAGRLEQRLERAIRTPACWPPPVLWSAAIGAKSPTFSVRTTRPLATAAPKSSASELPPS
jgi:hypothetical protein